MIGICHGVQGGIMQLAELMGVGRRTLEVVWIGTNHYYWFTRIRLHGQGHLPRGDGEGQGAPAPRTARS